MSNKIRDGEATKDKIIKTAEKLFAERGFNGVSIRDLANACGMSGPLILHHFKSKEGVYDAVKLALIKEYIPLFHNLNNDEKELFPFLENVIRGAFAFHRDNPIALRIMNWDRLNGNRKPWPKTEEFCRTFSERIQKAMDAGKVTSNFSAKYLGIMIGGMTHLWWEDRDRILEEILENPHDPKAVKAADEQYIQQILSFVKKFLEIK